MYYSPNLRYCIHLFCIPLYSVSARSPGENKQTDVLYVTVVEMKADPLLKSVQ